MRGGARQRYLQSADEGVRRDRSRSPRRTHAPTHAPRRGGARVAAIRAQASEPAVTPASRFHKYVSDLRLSAVGTQGLAMRAAGAGASGVTRMAAAGARGACPGNTHRDLLRQYLKGTNMPEVYMAEIDIHDPETDTDHNKVMHPFILPRELLDALTKQTEATVNHLSELAEGSPLDIVATRFAIDKQIPRHRVVPLGFHGDGVPHKKNRSAQVLSFNCLCKDMPERFLFTTIDVAFCCGCGCGGRCALDRMIEMFVWSLNQMATGRWPRRRHDGSRFLEKSDRGRARLKGVFFARGVLLQARGDWSWYTELFGFPSWASHRICWKCRATKHAGRNSFRKHGDDARWRRERIDSITFFSMSKRKPALSRARSSRRRISSCGWS